MKKFLLPFILTTITLITQENNIIFDVTQIKGSVPLAQQMNPKLQNYIAILEKMFCRNTKKEICIQTNVKKLSCIILSNNEQTEVTFPTPGEIAAVLIQEPYNLVPTEVELLKITASNLFCLTPSFKNKIRAVLQQLPKN